MSRGDGFAIADVATDLFEDGKVKALWRALAPDHAAMYHAMQMFEAALLASWGAGCRITVDEAAPLWLEVDERLVETLQGVRLLDRARRVTPRAWHGWYDPAAARREARRNSGAAGGVASGKARRSKAEATLKRRLKPRRSDAEAKPNPTVGASTKHLSRAPAHVRGGAARAHDDGRFAQVRARLQGNGTLRAKDRDALLAEPMPVEVSAAVAARPEEDQ